MENMERPLLVLCIDRDNDIYEKGKVSGPVIGREANVNAALKLALADPEDPDSNTIFYAVKIYDKLKKEGENAEVITLTGHKKLGYSADREISEQLDRIVRETHAESCILVSDGASDEEIIPVIRSRIKINSTKIVFIKQAKELEKTYFVLLDKIRDPYYARIIIGIPALLVLLLSASSYLGMSWQPVGIIVGIYLLLKGFGIEDYITSILSDFRFSFGNPSWVAYVGTFVIFIFAILVTYFSWNNGVGMGFAGEKLVANVFGNALPIFILAALFAIVGKSIDSVLEKRTFLITRYSLYAIALILAMLVLKTGSDWILNYKPPYVSFSDFFSVLLIAIIAGYVSTNIVRSMRTDMLVNMKLEGKEVINDHGTYIGKVVGINGIEGSILVQTMFEKKYGLPFNLITSVGENIIVKTGI